MGSICLIHFCFAPFGLVFFTILEITVGRIMKPVKLQNELSEQGHWIVDEIVKECYSRQYNSLFCSF